MDNKLKAIVFILLDCVAFTCSMALNKFISPNLPVSLKILIRASFGVLFFSPILIRSGLQVLRAKKPKLHILRIVFMSIAMGATYLTYTKLPFTIAISIGFTGPIFTLILAFFILKDRLKISQWVAIIVGYIGVLLIAAPKGKINYAIYVAILGNIVTGLSLIYAKKLTKVDSRSTIVMLANIGIVVVSFLCTFLYWLASIYENTWMHVTWIWPTQKDFKLLLVMGFLGTISQLSNITALQYASPSFLSLFEYSRLVLAIPISLLLGELLPGYQQIFGILLIILCTIYNSWQSNQSKI